MLRKKSFLWYSVRVTILQLAWTATTVVAATVAVALFNWQWGVEKYPVAFFLTVGIGLCFFVAGSIFWLADICEEMFARWAESQLLKKPSASV